MKTSNKRKDDIVMKQETMGATIAALRKDQGMTQQELAEHMGVTDKAVSKWERDLSCPDVSTLPKLAQILGVSVDDLLHTKVRETGEEKKELDRIIDLILKAIPLAMGVALIVISVLKKDLDVYTIAGFAGLGLFGISLNQIRKE